MTAAVVVALWLRRKRVQSFWPYVLGPGALSWAALYTGGFHPALALVPVVPLMPHSRRDLGVFDEREEYQADTLNRFEHWWTTPAQIVLLLFGFANAGVAFEQIGAGTYYVLAGLLIGKPIGIMLFSGIARGWRTAAAGPPTERFARRRRRCRNRFYGVAVLRHRGFPNGACVSRNKNGSPSELPRSSGGSGDVASAGRWWELAVRNGSRVQASGMIVPRSPDRRSMI